jgi:hypothetical protein
MVSNQPVKTIANLDDITVDECAILLKKALNSSPFQSIKQVAEKAQMNYHTLKHYFEGHRKPPNDKWNRICEVLAVEKELALADTPGGEKKSELVVHAKDVGTSEAEVHAKMLHCAMLLASEHLEYFKNATLADRERLRDAIDGKDVGYFTSLFASLYDEENLKAWKAFSK